MDKKKEIPEIKVTDGNGITADSWISDSTNTYSPDLVIDTPYWVQGGTIAPMGKLGEIDNFHLKSIKPKRALVKTKKNICDIDVVLWKQGAFISDSIIGYISKTITDTTFEIEDSTGIIASRIHGQWDIKNYKAALEILYKLDSMFFNDVSKKET